MQLEVLFEDAEIIVCYKPAGLATQTKRMGQQDMESLIKNYRALKKESPEVYVVHRLDQPVEGVMVFAKTSKAAAALSKQVADRDFGKRYYALAQKAQSQDMTPQAAASVTAALQKPMTSPAGTLCDYISFDKRTNVSRIVTAAEAKNPKNQAKEAKLDYQVIASGELDGVECQLFDVKLHTGRHHQIRLQLANAGWPLVGDTKYKGAAGKQLCLCSYALSFAHPKTGKDMEFKIQPKNELMQSFLPLCTMP